MERPRSAKSGNTAAHKPFALWRRRPAVRMWAGYLEALVRYGLEICRVWGEQGHLDSCAASLVTPGYAAGGAGGRGPAAAPAR